MIINDKWSDAYIDDLEIIKRRFTAAACFVVTLHTDCVQ